MVDVVKLITRCLEVSGLGQNALARAAGLDDGYMCHLRAGRRVPTLDVLARVASAAGLELVVSLAGPPDGSSGGSPASGATPAMSEALATLRAAERAPRGMGERRAKAADGAAGRVTTRRSAGTAVEPVTGVRPRAGRGAAPDPAPSRVPALSVGTRVGRVSVTKVDRGSGAVSKGAIYAWTCSCGRQGRGYAFQLRRAGARPCASCKRA